MERFLRQAERSGEMRVEMRNRTANHGGSRLQNRGRAAIWQARLVMLIMINLAQMWILSAAIEAALANDYHQLLPLVVASAVCWLISLTIILWWKPALRAAGRPA